MKIRFINAYGDTVDNVVFCAIPYALVDQGEEDLASSQGWNKMPYPPNKKIAEGYENIWTQLRLTRINLKKFKWNRDDEKVFSQIRQDYFYEIKPSTELSEEEIKKSREIFFKYIRRKKFLENENPKILKAYNMEFEYNCLMGNNKKVIFHYYKSELVAFSSFEVYPESVCGLQFAWDYRHKKLRLGFLEKNLLADIYKARGKKYYYLGMSYGKECSYKKRFHGFEFWTGKEWKTNRKEYERMCLNDSKVKSFADLERLSDSYLYE